MRLNFESIDPMTRRISAVHQDVYESEAWNLMLRLALEFGIQLPGQLAERKARANLKVLLD